MRYWRSSNRVLDMQFSSVCSSHQKPRHGTHGACSVGLCVMQAPRMLNRRSCPATPTVCAAQRSAFQLLVGASRQRAAPRSQFTNAASVALSHLIGYRGPRRTSATAPPIISLRSQWTRANANTNFMSNTNFRVTAFLGGVQALRPNNSLNRTHCGVPPFGLEKPSPNASTPQWAG
jgi:hypothetical protein